ncbi:MAG: hypothetical protein ABSA45_03265 [Verrucomicrobiota bacterium]|jgi:hypothetical protein
MISNHVGGGDLDSNQAMMINRTTTIGVRILQNITPPLPGTSCSRHDDFLSCRLRQAWWSWFYQ